MSGRLVIGIGHPDRGDDAVGRIVARRLRESVLDGIEIRDHDGEATTLVDWLADADDAILVDALVSGEAPGTVRRFDVAASALPREKFGMSTHGFGLADAVELARILGSLPARCVVYAVEGRSFGHGEPLSPEVDTAVDELVRRVLDEFRGRPSADA
jgi:hydrogenase maturation protease